MAENESDRIAKMLHALSSGEHADDESHKQEPHDDNIFGTPPQEVPPAPVVPKAAVPKPVAPKSPSPAIRPVVVPKVVAPAARPVPASEPKPVVPAPRPVSAAPRPMQGGVPAAPRPTAPPPPKPRPLAMPRPVGGPGLPPQPVARPAPERPAPPPSAPIPETAADEEEPIKYIEPVVEPSAEAVEEQAVASEEAAAEAEAYADDQMEMPAVPVSSLAQQRKKPVYKRKHMVQTLEFKQALIPISFTLFLVCMVYILIGFTVDANSPFLALRSPIVAGAFGLVGLAMLATCILTIGQVKNELAAKQHQQSEPSQA